MSAPDKSLKKQRKRHWGPLVGMALAVAVAAGLLFWWLGQEVVVEPVSEETPAQVDETTGLPARGDAVGPTDTGTPQVIEETDAPEN